MPRWQGADIVFAFRTQIVAEVAYGLCDPCAVLVEHHLIELEAYVDAGRASPAGVQRTTNQLEGVI